MFTQQQNIQMLWDVISDEEIFRFLNPESQSKVRDLFLKNIVGFYEMERTKTTSLVELNKKYILLILGHIKKTYTPSKIKIHNEPVELITYEEIHNDRKSQFERDFNARQKEFEDSISIKPPPVPEFSDKQIDTPIREMDKIIKEMQSKRNYEVDEINKMYNSSNQVENWLKPQETSLKNDKFKEEILPQNLNKSRFKFLDALQEDDSPNKKVTFSDKNEVFENDFDDDIFSKLKPVNNIYNDNNNNNNDNRIYKLERSVEMLNEKMDKILNLLSSKLS